MSSYTYGDASHKPIITPPAKPTRAAKPPRATRKRHDASHTPPVPKTPRHKSTGSSGGASSSHRSTSTHQAASSRPTRVTSRTKKKDPNDLGGGWFYDPSQNEIIFDPGRYKQETSTTSKGTSHQSKGSTPKEPKTIGEYDSVGKTTTWHHSHRVVTRIAGTPAHRRPH